MTSNEEATIRTAVAHMERALEQHRATSGDAQESLREPWAALVQSLALGPAPEHRTCPHCHKEVMRAATRCGFCWIGLSPA